MPLSVVPTSVNEPQDEDPSGASPETAGERSTAENGLVDSDRLQPDGPEPDSEGSGPRRVRGSRWVDYDTHELLNMISELEDERRWARLREGIWIAILVHLVLLSGLTWIPKYILKVPPVVDPFEAIKQRKEDLKYLDLPPDLIRRT